MLKQAGTDAGTAETWREFTPDPTETHTSGACFSVPLIKFSLRCTWTKMLWTEEEQPGSHYAIINPFRAVGGKKSFRYCDLWL